MENQEEKREWEMLGMRVVMGDKSGKIIENDMEIEFNYREYSVDN